MNRSAFADGAALFSLESYLRPLLVGGGDGRDYLQRMTTADLAALTPERWLPSALLNSKGRLLCPFAIELREAGEMSLWAETAGLAALIEGLEKLVILEDVTLAAGPVSHGGVSVQGPQSEEIVLALAAGLTLPVSNWEVVHAADLRIVKQPRCREGGFDLWSESEGLMDRLRSVGATDVEPAAIESARIDLGRPRFGAEISAENLPPECGHETAVSYTKGCFVGQEVVSRIHNLGHPNKLLRRLRFESLPGPAVGDEIFVGEAVVGRVASVAMDPAGGLPVALGFLKYRQADEGALVETGSHRQSGRLESLATL